ncbi:MAG: C40 family peptidase [Deltaproteobacteria bacterium]|nr:C40 family peptidase [Deltaproteobacteria bacterium]
MSALNHSKKTGRLGILPVFTSIFLLLSFTVSLSSRAETTMQKANRQRISNAFKSLPGASADQIRKLTDAVVRRFGDKLIEKAYLPSVVSLANAGIFEQVPSARIADTVYKAISAIKRGAPIGMTVELAQTCFARNMTEGQLLGAAMELRNFSTTRIPKRVYTDMVVQWLRADLGPNAMHAAMRTIQDGFRKGVDPGMVGLILLDRLLASMGYPRPGKVNDLPKKKARRVCENEMKKMAYAGKRTKELQRRRAIFKAMKQGIKNGVPSQLGQEVFLAALRKKWAPKAAEKVFQSLVSAARQRRILEPLADTLTKGLGTKANEKQAERQVEKTRRAEKKKSGNRSAEKAPKAPSKHKTGFSIDRTQMEKSINSFLGTPYLWGGNTRRGTDCSGFTSSVYREQGITIPRVARDQEKFAKHVPQSKAVFGDLVFFNKLGGNRVTHVGIYLGNGKMAHASCSKGVTIAPLNRRYYQARFHSMGDIVRALH